MVNGFGNFLNIKMPKLDLGIDLKSKPIKLFPDSDQSLKLKPIDFGPSFSVTSKQGLIKPIKQSGSIQATKVASAKKELASVRARQQTDPIGVQNRVKGILNGKLALEDVNNTDVLEASGLARPTASKVRENIRNEQRGLLNKVQGASVLSNREFQVAFISDAGVVQQRTFRDRDEAMAFKETLDAQGLLETGSPATIREVRV
jgi:hypothetical protein